MEMIWIIIASVSASAAGVYLFMIKKLSQVRAENSILIDRDRVNRQKIEEVTTQLQKAQQENNDITARNIRLATQQEHLQEQLQTQRQEMLQMQEKLQKDFELLSAKILERNSEKFSSQNRQLMNDLFSPLKERMEKYETRILQNQKQNHELGAALREQLLNFRDLGLQMSHEAKNLTKALKGDNKQQGNWGEIILERLLEISGLEKDREYVLQGSGMALKDEAGKRQQPDVVVLLPENKHLVIDAKVSLVAYESFCNQEDERERQACLQQHLHSVRTHVRQLSEKKYHFNEKLISPDFVLMFIPVEPSFMLALQHDAQLFDFGWEKRIVLVSPTTLLATLRTVASIWKYEKQNANAMEIARLGGLLYDQFVGFTDDLEKVGRSIDSSQKAYDSAMHKLRDSRQSLMSRAQRLHKLGVKAGKELTNVPEEESEGDNLE